MGSRARASVRWSCADRMERCFAVPEQSVIQALGLPWPMPAVRWSPANAAEWRANPAPALGLAEAVEIMRKIEAARVRTR